jgi:hypothetical protein
MGKRCEYIYIYIYIYIIEKNGGWRCTVVCVYVERENIERGKGCGS